MKYAAYIMAYIMLSAVFISTAGFAGEPANAPKEQTVAEQAGPTAQAPAELHLKIAGHGFQLTWSLSPQDPGAVTGYEIVRSDIYSGPYETVGKVDQGVSSFVDQTAKPEVVSFYKIRALTGGQPSPFSKVAAGEITKRP